MPMGKQFLNFVDDDSASIDPLPEPKKTEEPVKQVPKKKTSLFGRLFEGSK
jgi:hypothetical protein